MKATGVRALINGTLIDGTGRDPVAGATVLIGDDGRITAAGAGVEPPRHAEVIDVSGRTIMPGLIDCHVHFFLEQRPLNQEAMTPFTLKVFEAAENARKALDAGVTSARDTGGTPRGFRMAAERGLIAAPRIRTAVSFLSQTGGHGDFTMPAGFNHNFGIPAGRMPEWPESVCDGVDGVRKRAREVLRAGADFIKIMATGGVLSPADEPGHTQFTREEISAIVYEARAQGKYVAAHVQGLEGIRNAVECGVRTVEHAIYVDEEVASLIRERGTFVVPTFHAPRGVLKAEEAVPGSILPQSLRKIREVMEVHEKNIRMAIEMGVKIAMGTDVGVGFHGTNAEEVTYLVEMGGMLPMDAIVASTKTAAECARLDADTGTLEAGKCADLLVVDGDPLADISVLEDRSKLLMIVQGGRAHKDLILE